MYAHKTVVHYIAQLISTVAIRMLFLGEALTTMLVYVWCRRNPFVRYNFFGLFTFEAPYLPWILVLISILFGGSVLADLVGKPLPPPLSMRANLNSIIHTHTHTHTHTQALLLVMSIIS